MKHSILLASRAIAGAAMLLSFALPLNAQTTITFNGLSSPNGTPFTGPYEESGFRVTVISGAICEAHGLGNPIPDLFGGFACNNSVPDVTLSIRRTGLEPYFRFLSTDLRALNNVFTYNFTGESGGIALYFGSGIITANNGFNNYASPDAVTYIDDLRISFSNGIGTSFNIDNIKLEEYNVPTTTAPEPATLAFVAFGLAGVACIRRRRRA